MSGDGQGSGTHDQDAGAAIAAILAGYGESFCVIGADWRITAINHPTETFSGLDAHQIIGSSYWDVAPAAVATAQGDLLRRAMAERSFLQADVPSARQPGRILAMRMFPLGDGLGLIFSDVTEQREQSRREHEQAMRLELALAASGMGDWSWDAVTDVVTLSPRAAEVYRAPYTTMTWAEMRALLHPDDAPWVRREARASVAEHRRYDAEYRLAPTPDLPEVWVLIRGAP